MHSTQCESRQPAGPPSGVGSQRPNPEELWHPHAPAPYLREQCDCSWAKPAREPLRPCSSPGGPHRLPAALWMGSSGTSSSHPSGGWGTYRADTGLGPLDNTGSWREGCGPSASLFPSYTGPHWLRIWEVRRTTRNFPTPGIILSFGFSPPTPASETLDLGVIPVPNPQSCPPPPLCWS